MNSYKAAQSQARGEMGEAMARAALARMGYTNIHKGRGKWLVTSWLDRKRFTARVVADPEQKLHGDWQAIEPTSGRAVWAEVKARSGKLLYSHLKDHQVAGLDDHARNNGIALLIWVSDETTFVFDWPMSPPFAKGQSIDGAAAVDRAVIIYGNISLLIGETSTINRDYDYDDMPQLLSNLPMANNPLARKKPNPVWQFGGREGRGDCPECKRGSMKAQNSEYGSLLVCDYCNRGILATAEGKNDV